MFERFTAAAREVVIGAQRAGRDLRHTYIGTEHLLLGVLAADEAGPAGRALRDVGVHAEAVRGQIVRRVGAGPEPLGDADAEALRAIGIDLDAVRAKVEDSFGPGALDQPVDTEETGGWPLRRMRGRRRGPRGHVPFTPRAKKVLELSLREAIYHGDRRIGPEHILLGLVREGKGLAAEILVGSGVDLDDLRRRTLAGREAAA